MLLNVEGFCCFFQILKVLTHTFKCWSSYFYFLMLQVIDFILRCSMFLLLVLDVEISCSCFWILKVLTFVSWKFKVLALTFRCWRFLLLDVESFYFYSWMLRVCDSWSFVYLHTLKKNDVKIYSILFRSWLYKFSLTYNDERFMKGDFLMIIMLHMSCFVFEFFW